MAWYIDLVGANRWDLELEWMFKWSGAELGERSAFPTGNESFSGGAPTIVTPTKEQCAAARKQRRIKRVLLALSSEHMAVLEAAYGPARDMPTNLAAKFGITRKVAIVAWSMQRALVRLGRKVTTEVAL